MQGCPVAVDVQVVAGEVSTVAVEPDTDCSDRDAGESSGIGEIDAVDRNE